MPDTGATRRRLPPAAPSVRRHAIALATALCGLPLLGVGGAAQAADLTLKAAAEPVAGRYAPLGAGSAADAGLSPRRLPWQADAGDQLRSERDGLDYAANAAVARLLVEADRDGLPADGQSGVTLTLRVFGADGQPLPHTVLLTLEVSGGRLRLPGARTDEAGPLAQDADPVTPGVQLRVQGGVAQVMLLAPHEPQDVTLRVSAGSQQVQGHIGFVPDVRPMLAAGLIEGTLNLRNGGIEPVERGDVFEREIRSWSREFDGGKGSLDSRAAFYLKGRVRGDLLLSAAYDSDADTRARLLRDIKPDELYPVYGDSALRSHDAPTRERLYVRVDQGRRYALYGELNTGDGYTQLPGQTAPQGATAALKQRSLGAYNRSATGLKLHEERDGLVLNGAAFQDSLRQVVEEFASQGSGPYGLRNSAVLEGSEKLEVLVRDKAQPSRILSVRTLTRLADYSFEPFSGRILLTQYLPAVDENLNPVSLRVSYEVDQGGDSFWVGVLDGQWRASNWLELGGALARDANPLAPYTLGSVNATLRLGEGTLLVAELARSQSTVNTNSVNASSSAGLSGVSGETGGNAWRIELSHRAEGRSVQGFAGRSEPTFDNSAAPLSGGRGEAWLRAEQRLSDSLSLQGEALRSEDRTDGGGSAGAAGLGLRWQASERLSLRAGLRSQRETVGQQALGLVTAPFGSTAGLSGSLASGSGGGALGYGNQALDPVSGLPLISGSSLSQASSGLASGTRLSSDSLVLGAGWRASPRVTLGGEVEDSLRGDARRRLALGADYQLAERTRLYARAERQQGWVQQSGSSDTGRGLNLLAAGVTSSLAHDTQLFSEYRLRDALSGRDAQLASGVRQGFDLAPGLRASAGFERVQVVAGNAAAAQATLLGLDYGANPLWRGSAKLEHRRSGDVANTAGDDGFDTTLAQLMAARKLDRDWTLLARHYTLYTNYSARGNIAQHRAQLGLAWRPVDHNRFNALARLEYKHEADDSDASVGQLRQRAWIAAGVADWHPSRPWWLTGRLAGKWQTDRFEDGLRDSFSAQMLSGRVVYDLSERWDLGAMAALQLGQHGARQQAYGVEAGYLMATNLWLSAGFNLSGFAGDADLAGYEYTRRGAFLRLRFKFDETLFRSGDRQINRSLER